MPCFESAAAQLFSLGHETVWDFYRVDRAGE
jgi:hypothetical protein